jgi:photosystem II stability/assembly factor-like uncharacterized protein
MGGILFKHLFYLHFIKIKTKRSMKNFAITLFALLISGFAPAQWTSLNSTTLNTLHDVDFISPDYGAVAGNNGTVLLTTDGGTTWTDIAHHLVTGDVYSITIKNTDTLYVSTFDFAGQAGLIYKTENGGATWDTIATDNLLAHKTDLALPVTSRLYAIGSSLVSTINAGASWDTLSNSVAGTNILDKIKFADPQTGHVSGLISGFVTYSAYFFRTEDSGGHWYPCDVFSFPNADALTTMCFRGPDTAYIFTNHYNGFMPGNTNGFVKIYDFQQSIPFPGDTTFMFSNQIVNNAMPALMNDAIYLSNDSAFAFGNDGNVYVTTDGGTSWAVNYNAGYPLYSVTFIDGIGYAAGGNGTVIKFSTASTPVPAVEAGIGINIHPSLASDLLYIDAGNLNRVFFEIVNVKGEKVYSGVLHPMENTVNVSRFGEGNYYINFHVQNKSYTKNFTVSH